jgi:hypothetical protein
MPLVITKQVRKIMRTHGRSTIYTNKLVNNRTIKCYANQFEPEVNDTMIAEIKKRLTADNIPHTIYYHSTESFYGDVTAIIVRIPKE